MKVMRTTVATLLCATAIDECFLCVCRSKPDRRGGCFPPWCMPNELTLTRKKPVIKLTTRVSVLPVA